MLSCWQTADMTAIIRRGLPTKNDTQRKYKIWPGKWNQQQNYTLHWCLNPWVMTKNRFREGKSTLTFVHQTNQFNPVQGDISAKFERVPEIWHSQELDRRTIWGHNSSGHGCHWHGDKNIQAASWTWAVMRACLCKHWCFQCSYTSLKGPQEFWHSK